MPASRSPARQQTMVSFHNAGSLSLQNYEAHPGKGTHSKAPIRDVPEPTIAPPTRKRKHSPNAFILFRSFIIANKILPPELTHQNDISRYIAELWRSASASDRIVFFRKAEQEKLREEIEGPGDVYKAKRVRTRKARPSKAAELDKPFDVPARPTATSDGPSSSSLSFGLSPDVAGANMNQFMSNPTTSIPFGVPSAAAPEIPQVEAAIPPNLPNWAHPTEVQISEGQFYTDHDFSYLSGVSPFLSLPYDASFDVGFSSQLDSVLSSDTNNSSPSYSGFDFLSPSFHAAPCGSSFSSFDA